MAFRIRQKLTVFQPQKILSYVLQPNSETGVGEYVKVDDCAELPDPSTMDLGLMVKAGVPLNEVDSKLLNPTGTVLLGSSEVQDVKKE